MDKKKAIELTREKWDKVSNMLTADCIEEALEEAVDTCSMCDFFKNCDRCEVSETCNDIGYKIEMSKDHLDEVVKLAQERLDELEEEWF